MQLTKILGLAVLLGAAVGAYAAKEESIADRIAPAGKLCMSGDACAAAVAAAAGNEARDGKTVYDTKCMACHATGAAGAPKFGDAAAWAPRVSERGQDGLYTSSIKGFKAMPPKGLCMDCTDDELKAAVDYILENSQ